MSYENWKNKAQGFQTVDVRHIQGSFFEGLKKRAEALEVGEGLHIIQTFEPHPLYAVMEGLGYEHHTEQRSEAEFHVWFCRVEKKEGDSSAPFKPLALLNYPMIDEKLGQIAVDFWETTWQSDAGRKSDSYNRKDNAAGLFYGGNAALRHGKSSDLYGVPG